MESPSRIRSLVGAACVGALVLAATSLARESTQAEQAKRGEPQARPVGPDAGTRPSLEQFQEWDREEQLARAREEVEVLEIQLGVRKARLRKAEKRLEIERTLQADFGRAKKMGVASAVSQKRADLAMLDAEEQLALRQAELVDMEKRLSQARRRVALIERRGPAGVGVIEVGDRDVVDLKDRMGRMERRCEDLQEGLNDAKDEIRRLAALVEG